MHELNLSAKVGQYEYNKSLNKNCRLTEEEIREFVSNIDSGYDKIKNIIGEQIIESSINSYIFKDLYNLGKHFFYECNSIENEEELEKYIDFNSYGKDIIKKSIKTLSGLIMKSFINLNAQKESLT